MREIRSSGSVEGVISDHDSYSDFCCSSITDFRNDIWRNYATTTLFYAALAEAKCR